MHDSAYPTPKNKKAPQMKRLLLFSMFDLSLGTEISHFT